MKTKKFISSLLFMVIFVSIFAVPTFADTAGNSRDFTIANGVLTTYNGAGGDVTIPSTVTSINDKAFYYCKKITSVTIPSSVTDISTGAFALCVNLSKISVDINNQNYASKDGVLLSKDQTKLIQYPSGNTQTAYTIPSTVASIGYGAFGYCNELAAITIPNSVTDIGECAFADCSDLTSVTIPNSVIAIGKGGFCNCTSLTSVTIPTSVTSIGVGAFSNCEKLTAIKIPASVTSIGNAAFNLCTNLAGVSVDARNPNYTSMNGVLFNKKKTQLIEYPAGIANLAYTIPGGVTSIDDDAFECSDKLTAITIPSSVTTIGARAFDACVRLVAVTIPKSVKRIGDDAFFSCRSLTAVTIPSSVTTIGKDAFADCGNPVLYGANGSYAQLYAKKHNISFSTGKVTDTGPSFGRVKYSATVQTNRNVTVTIPVTGATVASVTHTFISNGRYTFTVTDFLGREANRTIVVSNIDKAKPVIKAAISNGKRTKDKVTISVSDANLKSKSVKVSGKGISWPKNNTFTKKGSYSITTSDQAGNTSKFVFSIIG